MGMNQTYAVFGLGRYGRSVAKELVDELVTAAIEAGVLRAVNISHNKFREILTEKPKKEKKKRNSANLRAKERNLQTQKLTLKKRNCKRLPSEKNLKRNAKI